MQKIYILLPVHNRRAVTELFIDCLAAQTYANYHLILIDDGSTDNTDQMAQAKIKNITVLKGRGNWWWAGSLQQGINWLEQAGVDDRDIVLFANDDISFDANFLHRAAGILDGLHATLLLPYLRDEKTGLPQESGVEADLRKQIFKPASAAQQINCLPTRGLFMRMADLRRIGGFYPKLLPHYWSDYEFTIRARRKGLALVTSPELVISLDHTQTGIRSFEAAGIVMFIRQCFSKRSVFNPMYHSIFIFMTSRLPDVPSALLRVWGKVVVYLLYRVKLSLKMRLGRLLGARQNKGHIKRAIRQERGRLKIIAGSASTRQEGWISTDYPLLDLGDERTFAALFVPGEVRNFLAEHVWEHLPQQAAAAACANCFKYLRPGGKLRLAVPDGFHPDADYIAQVKPGGYGAGADDHQVLYNYKTLSAILENAGFQTRLLEWFDEQGQFRQNDWDIADGLIRRSTRFDPRNREHPTAYTSLIIDAIKPS